MSVTMRNSLRDSFEVYLNDLGCPDHDHPETGDGRVPYSHVEIYGTWLRQNDPIAFNVAFNEWILEGGDKVDG